MFGTARRNSKSKDATSTDADVGERAISGENEGALLVKALERSAPTASPITSVRF